MRSVVPFDTASSRLTLTVEDEVYSTLHEIHIDFDVEKRDFIAGISVGPSPGDNRDRHPVTRAQCLSAAKNVCARGAASGVFSGAVLIARGADVLFEYACGETNKRYRVPNDLDTRFNLGSLNKMFTATAVAQLVERGRLKLTDAIDHFIDESWLPQAVTHGITVHHVLSHTSGLGSFFNDTFIDGSRARLRAIDDFKPLVRSDRPAFTPGAAFRYSNIGMLLAGVVIERVAGIDYFDHIRKNIYGPCGMSSMDCYDIDAPVGNVAIDGMLEPEGSAWRENIFDHVAKGGPAGGGYSTVRDLHRFAQGLRSGCLIGEEMLTALWTDHAGADYGYGFEVVRGAAGTVVGHNGGFSGISASFQMHLDSEYVVVTLSNHDRGARNLARRLNAMVDDL
ncbi:MAG: serine hydrolase domain-containing protein, partial [Janthinobacterium lividum]